MAQEKFVFDRNQFTRDILQSANDSKQSFDELLQAHKYKDYSMRKYELPTDDQAKEDLINYHKQQNQEHNVRLIETFYQIFKNPENEQAQAFFEYWNFIHDIFNSGDTSQLPVVIKKSETLLDEETQLALHKYIVEHKSSVIKAQQLEASLTYIVNSKYTDGIYKASKINQLVDLHFSAYRDKKPLPEEPFDKDKKVIEDILESLKGDLDKELKKDYPDTRTLNNIIDRAQDILDTYSTIIRRVTGTISIDNPDYIYFKTMTDDTFNKDKILALDVDYVPNHNKIIEQEYGKAKSEVLYLQSRMQQNNNIMQGQVSQLTSQVASEQRKNEQ
nr:hypothetical protein [Candidatus Enterousia merdequi]